MTNWQPIATAPKDGTRVDLWCINTMDDSGNYPIGPTRFADSFWSADYTQVPRWIDRSDETVEDNGWKATHWMPLPAPPVQP